MRILVLRGGAIGDFVLTLPAFSALRSRWPEAVIEIVGYPHIAELALAGGLVDRITSLDKADMARFFSLKPQFSEEQRQYVASFDLVISYLYDPDQTVCRNMKGLGVSNFVYGSPIVREGHAVDHLLRPLEELAIYPENEPYPCLAPAAPVLAEGRRRAGALGRRLAVLHPGSGSARKNWPLERFLALAARVTDHLALTPVLLLGEADQAIVERLDAMRPNMSLLKELSLVQTAGVLSACAAFVGNDSGITHLAAALGRPAVAVFGPTDAATWGPRGPNVAVCASGAADGALEDVGVETVLGELTRLCKSG